MLTRVERLIAKASPPCILRTFSADHAACSLRLAYAGERPIHGLVLGSRCNVRIDSLLGQEGFDFWFGGEERIVELA